MIDRMLALATGLRAVLALACLALVGFPLFRWSPYSEVKSLLGGANLPEEAVTSPERLQEALGILGVGGRELYLRFQAWDLLNPILIGVTGAMVLGWLLKRSGRGNSRWRFVLLFPVAALGADLLENVVISTAIRAFPEPTGLANALPLVTAAKFAAVVATLVSAVAMVFAWGRDRFSGASKPAT